MSPLLLTHTRHHAELTLHANSVRNWHLRDLFAHDATRGERYQIQACGILLDFAKQRCDDQTITLLAGLADECKLGTRREAMFSGERINTTEGRAVLHTALRAPSAVAPVVDGESVGPAIHAVLARMRAFSERVRQGEWLGFRGDRITDVVNIGIGGSDLGPKMACAALRDYGRHGPRVHFVANVDGHDLASTLNTLRPETTLFIVASKTFTTAETMRNAHSARAWFLQAGSTGDLPRHFVAVSTNAEAVAEFGINTANMFEFWDWVGGRYSIWSAIGLPLMLAVGAAHHSEFLAGAHAMDEHFRTAPMRDNLPVMMALLGIWNRNYLGASSLSIAPYHHYLSSFPDYLQQLDMESNGKRVSSGGEELDYATGPVVWGNVGTNAQHAYFQLLHQGSDCIPVDFIATIRASHDLQGHQQALLANCLAQSEAFMRGKNAEEVRSDLRSAGLAEEQIAQLLPHKVFPGNRPSNTLLLDDLTPFRLGALIALYEHKVFVQGCLWGINSFDQWGVELGKILAKSIETELNDTPRRAQHDSSTNALIARIRAVLRTPDQEHSPD